MEKFESVYSIGKWTGKLTWFHKKYYVFDGIGFFFFDTLVESRCFVRLRASCLKNLYNTSKTFYKKLSEHYFDKLIKFRILNTDNNRINSLLCDCLGCYKFLSKQFFPQYIISKLKYIYDCFLSIAKILKMNVLYKTIENVKNSFYIPYPRFDSSLINNAKKLNINELKTLKACVG
jgi:hypothetical protein